MTARRPLDTLRAADLRLTGGDAAQVAGVRNRLLARFAGRNEEWLAAVSAQAYTAQVDPDVILLFKVEALIAALRYEDALRTLDGAPAIVRWRDEFLEGVGKTPSARFRGWVNLLREDRSAATADGRAVLEFVAQQQPTLWNGWFLRILEAEGRLFAGDMARAQTAAREAVEATAASRQPSRHGRPRDSWRRRCLRGPARARKRPRSWRTSRPRPRESRPRRSRAIRGSACPSRATRVTERCKPGSKPRWRHSRRRFLDGLRAEPSDVHENDEQGHGHIEPSVSSTSTLRACKSDPRLVRNETLVRVGARAQQNRRHEQDEKRERASEVAPYGSGQPSAQLSGGAPSCARSRREWRGFTMLTALATPTSK